MENLKSPQLAIPVVLMAGIFWSFGPYVVRNIDEANTVPWQYLFTRGMVIFILLNLYLYMEEGIYFSDNLSILISNQSGYAQYYDYHLFDSEGWFGEELNSFVLNPYSTIELNFSPSNINNDVSNLTFNITPTYHNYDSKNYNFQIYAPQMNGHLNFDGME